MKIKLLTILLSVIFLVPSAASALEISDFFQSSADLGLSSRAYLIAERGSGKIIVSKNSSQSWVPASLTKLVTLLTILDTKPKLTKSVSMKAEDQTAGQCSKGGACIATKPGVSYSVDGLFHASLIASANNATYALARSSGLSVGEFVKKMNEKAASLGALNTRFVEPTGIDPANTTTAEDYAKIAAAAFADPYLKKLAGLKQYTLKSNNNKKYVHKLKNTNKLLDDDRLGSVAGKTGFLEESGYNFVSLAQDRFGNSFVVVVFGSRSASAEFEETRLLVDLAGLNMVFGGQVLGTSTTQTINFVN